MFLSHHQVHKLEIFQLLALHVETGECCIVFIFPRYKIHVRVTDESGTTTLVIFDQDAEKLLDASAKKFMNRLGTGNNQIPAEISNLTGKSFVFKIKLTDYNLKDGFENYTVVKIFEADKSVETYEFRSENAEVFMYVCLLFWIIRFTFIYL